MKKILLLIASCLAMTLINPMFAEEKKEPLEQEKKSDDAMQKEMGHDMKHHRMKHHKMTDEKKDEDKKEKQLKQSIKKTEHDK